MRKESEAFAASRGLSVERGLISFASVLGDGTGDGLVQAVVQHPKVGRVDRRVHFDSQFRDGLADVAIVMHHL